MNKRTLAISATAIILLIVALTASFLYGEEIGERNKRAVESPSREELHIEKEITAVIDTVEYYSTVKSCSDSYMDQLKEMGLISVNIYGEKQNQFAIIQAASDTEKIDSELCKVDLEELLRAKLIEKNLITSEDSLIVWDAVTPYEFSGNLYFSYTETKTDNQSSNIVAVYNLYDDLLNIKKEFDAALIVSDLSTVNSDVYATVSVAGLVCGDARCVEFIEELSQTSTGLWRITSPSGEAERLHGIDMP